MFKNNVFVRWLRRKVKSYFGLYDINDLVVGGHCGCCGEWIPNEIVEKDWKVGLCKNCKQGAVKCLKLK